LYSIERVSRVKITTDVDFQHLASSQEVFDLAMLLARYEDVLAFAEERCEPSLLTNYLLDLARLVNAANASLRVKDQPPRIAEGRMVTCSPLWRFFSSFNSRSVQLLLWCVRSVLANGLRLLGLDPLREM